MAKKVQNEAERPEEQLQDDSPIDNVNQDRFGRTQFVQNLAKALITETKQKTKSKVIALTGKWGVGKSSVINMVKDEIKKSENKNLYVLDFNPWQFTDSDDLIKPFESAYDFLDFGLAGNRRLYVFLRRKKKGCRLVYQVWQKSICGN